MSGNLKMLKVRRIFIATLPNGTFVYTGKVRRGLLGTELASLLSVSLVPVQVVRIDELFEHDLGQDDLVIYTSSDEPSIRGYIKDVMYLVSKRCQIIPNYEALLAHENKGFQELMRRDLNVGNLHGGYHFDLDARPQEYPFVFKTIDGAGSTGVALVRDRSDLKRIRRRYFARSMTRKMLLALRRLQFDERSFALYAYRHKGFCQFVFQDYIKDLDFDYKVLVFGNRYYVLRREVRRNDFRASGSGRFSFVDPPKEVLEFAHHVFMKLSVPYASLDVAFTGKQCNLIEYQVFQFGLLTLIDSDGHYLYEDGSWFYIKGRADICENFGYAIRTYFDKLGVDVMTQ